MPTTPQNQAANFLNTLISLGASLDSIRTAIDAAANFANEAGGAGILSAFPTAPLSADGSLGTPDATPDTSHPIDTRTPAGELLSRAFTANDAVALLNALGGVANVIRGQALTANGQTPTLIAKCVG